MKKTDKRDKAEVYNTDSSSLRAEEQMKAVTIKEIKEYIDDYPYELLTPEEEDKVREEIVTWKNGGCVLDGITTELQLKSITGETFDKEYKKDKIGKYLKKAKKNIDDAMAKQKTFESGFDDNDF